MSAGRDTAVREPGLEDPIPISALQHAVYCLRQAALIHIERLWEDNRFTAEGRVLHDHTDKPGRRRLRGLRRISALPLASSRLGIAGVADLVEFLPGHDGETPYPVEFKRGKAKLHRADEVQLCAQALCLEEMTGRSVSEGAIYYAETKRRVSVPMDDALRCLTQETIRSLATVFRERHTPPPTTIRSRCRSCSLKLLCRPDAVAKPVLAWRRRLLNALLEADPAP